MIPQWEYAMRWHQETAQSKRNVKISTVPPLTFHSNKWSLTIAVGTRFAFIYVAFVKCITYVWIANIDTTLVLLFLSVIFSINIFCFHICITFIIALYAKYIISFHIYLMVHAKCGRMCNRHFGNDIYIRQTEAFQKAFKQVDFDKLKDISVVSFSVWFCCQWWVFNR